MAATIRIKLGDLLPLLMESRRPLNPEIEKDVEAIKQYLMTSGPAGSRDLAMELHMSDGAMIHRLVCLNADGLSVAMTPSRYTLIRRFRKGDKANWDQFGYIFRLITYANHNNLNNSSHKRED